MARPTPRCLFRPALSMLRSTRGSLLLALLMTISFSALGSPFFTIGMTETRLQRRATIEMVAKAIAESGIELAIWEYNTKSGAFATADGWTVVPTDPIQCPVGRCVQRNYTVTTAPEDTPVGTSSILVRDADGEAPSVISTGTLAAMEGGTVIEVALARGSGPQQGFLHAAFAEGSNWGVWLQSGASTDSYDSSLGSYSAFPPRGNGNVGTNRAVPCAPTYPAGEDAIDLTDSGTIVNGDAFVGPGWDPNTGVFVQSGTTLTGAKLNLTQTIPLSSVAMPSCDAAHQLGSVLLVGSSTLTLAAGTWCANSLIMNGAATKLSSAGPVKLYVRDYIALQQGATIESDGGTSIRPERMQIYQDALGANIPSNPNVYWRCQHYRFCVDGSTGPHSKITATLYVPNGYVSIASSTDWYGAIVGDWVNIDAGHVHYDEHLATAATDFGTGPGSGVTVTSWTRRALQGGY